MFLQVAPVASDQDETFRINNKTYKPSKTIKYTNTTQTHSSNDIKGGSLCYTRQDGLKNKFIFLKRKKDRFLTHFIIVNNVPIKYLKSRLFFINTDGASFTLLMNKSRKKVKKNKKKYLNYHKYKLYLFLLPFKGRHVSRDTPEQRNKCNEMGKICI